MSNLFDDLIREGRDTDALRLFARTYYENGKMGHTRLMLLVRIADESDSLQAELDRLQVALKATIAEKEKYKRAFEEVCRQFDETDFEAMRDSFLKLAKGGNDETERTSENP